MANSYFRRLFAENGKLSAAASAESRGFDADAIIRDAEAELFYSTSTEVGNDLPSYSACDYVNSAMIAMSLDW